MDQLAHHYRAHIAELNRRVAEILSRSLVWFSDPFGSAASDVLDDINYPFKANRTSRHGCLCWIIRIVG